MPNAKPARTLIIAASLLLLTISLAASAAAQRLDVVLHSFKNNGVDGYNPSTSLILDAVGNLYGVTSAGGTQSGGTVFELSPSGAAWSEKVLYSFPTGSTPAAGVTLGAGGVLYGVTSGGGDFGAGTVFSLVPETGGRWQETTLHSFDKNGIDGADPIGSLILDASGNIYGTTFEGGTDGVGTVFELSPQPLGVWAETILHSFVNDGSDGHGPSASLTFDKLGNLYGTTNTGGNSGNCSLGCGTVFQLTPSGGAWSETIIHNFTTVQDGIFPIGGLTFDTKGNLFGLATQGADGVVTAGAVFELSSAAGVWSESAIYQFGTSIDGASPAFVTPVFDPAGNLYGTTSAGGASSVGTVFELSPYRRSWTEKVIHSFSSGGRDGQSPMGSVLLDSSGNIYGTTLKGGGPCGCGTVFEIKK